MGKGVGNLARIALNAGRLKSDSGERDIVDIITFIESEWGLNMSLFPIQKIILKAHYGIALALSGSPTSGERTPRSSPKQATCVGCTTRAAATSKRSFRAKSAGP
jgi:hypothetical protein